MDFKLFVLYLIFNIFLTVGGLTGVKILTPATGLKLLKNITTLRAAPLVTPYSNNTTGGGIALNCIQIQCKFVCFNGKSAEIEKDILMVSNKNHRLCPIVKELRLYNYEFTNNELSPGFLGNYYDKVETLHLTSSNITKIKAGAFAKGRFQEIYFENLQISELRKDFFKEISSDFEALHVVQKEKPVQSVHADFLCYVRNQIKYLTLQAGLTSVRNLTGKDYVLHNLVYVDFSYSDFADDIKRTTFSKLLMVEHLDLSHSNMEYLPSDIFAGLSSTLKHLDLSNNKLKTISRTIFGWTEIPKDLKIFANNNEWSCSCELQMELKVIFKYDTTNFLCSQPDQYKGWSVFYRGICDVSSMENLPLPEPISEDPTLMSTTVKNNRPTTADVVKEAGLVKLNCLAGSSNVTNGISQHMQWPWILFNVSCHSDLRADITISSSAQLDNSFALIWFSEATTRLFKMELNYYDYVLGCYSEISFLTTVVGLLPNTAYTFCIVKKTDLTISPFSCKSIHATDNLDVETSAWLSRGMRVTGLSLVILGIILFSFSGILIIYLLLKRKPILLKASKRVTRVHRNSNTIVVLPKESSRQTIKEKEEELARIGSQIRRKSTESMASYQSYINVNEYEVIPAFSKQYNVNLTPPCYEIPGGKPLQSMCDQVTDDFYLSPAQTPLNSLDSVHYAKIPHCAKRKSTDALPAVPAEQSPPSLALRGTTNKCDHTQCGTFYALDCQV